MTTTTYGYRMPETGDRAKGTGGWYETIEFDITRLDGHNHDGVNSVALTFASLVPYTGTIATSDWSASGTGYRALVTVPVAILDVNDWNVAFIFTAPAGKVGERACLTMDRQTATTFYVYCNDNTAAFSILYR